MKQTILVLASFFLLVNLHAQVVNINGSEVKTFYPDTSGACDPETIFTIVETMPEYKGGEFQLKKDMASRLQFDKEINGTIFISVYVNCQDQAYAFQVLRGFDEETDKMVVQQLSELQQWSSGIQRDQKVDCNINLGFKFKNGQLVIPKPK